VRDLRSLRDAAFTLRSYGRHDDCERLLANIRELISGPHGLPGRQRRGGSR
jgi:hypothetical protein